MTTLYAAANPRSGATLYAGDPTTAEGQVFTCFSSNIAAATAVVMGVGDRGVQDTETGASDDLVAQAATVVGSGVKIHRLTGSGVLTPTKCALAGAGAEVPLRAGVGDLVAPAAGLRGVGEIAGQVAGVGALQATAAALLGSGGFSADILVLTSGSIVAHPGVLTGTGSVAALIVETDGALVAGSARMYGVGGSGPIAIGPPGHRRYHLRPPGGPRRPTAQ
jgi:hypothetical protein